MSMQLMVKAMSISVGNPLRKLVLLKLADNASDSGECWPSYQHIADQCEIARSTVKSHIRELEKAGLLRREFRKDGDLNKSNVFHLTLDQAKDVSPSKTPQEGGAANNPVGRHLPEGGAADNPPGAADNLGGGAADNPITSHSFEPVKEPVIEPTARKQKNTFSLPVGLNLDAWSLWVQYRSDRKFKPYKQTALGAGAVAKNLIDLSSGDPSTQLKIVMQSINNQWQGLFELKSPQKSNQSKIYQAQQAARQAIANGSVSYDPNIPFDCQ